LAPTIATESPVPFSLVETLRPAPRWAAAGVALALAASILASTPTVAAAPAGAKAKAAATAPATGGAKPKPKPKPRARKPATRPPKAAPAPAPTTSALAEPAPTETAVAAPSRAAKPGADVVRTEADRTGVKTYTFGAQEVEGRLKSPQILYFLRRVRAQFDPAPLGHRSFLLELSDTRRHPALD
jgi:hypothetical protein